MTVRDGPPSCPSWLPRSSSSPTLPLPSSCRQTRSRRLACRRLLGPRPARSEPTPTRSVCSEPTHHQHSCVCVCVCVCSSELAVLSNLSCCIGPQYLKNWTGLPGSVQPPSDVLALRRAYCETTGPRNNQTVSCNTATHLRHVCVIPWRRLSLFSSARVEIRGGLCCQTPR